MGRIFRLVRLAQPAATNNKTNNQHKEQQQENRIYSRPAQTQKVSLPACTRLRLQPTASTFRYSAQRLSGFFQELRTSCPRLRPPLPFVFFYSSRIVCEQSMSESEQTSHKRTRQPQIRENRQHLRPRRKEHPGSLKQKYPMPVNPANPTLLSATP